VENVKHMHVQDSTGRTTAHKKVSKFDIYTAIYVQMNKLW